jgi:hypothetical protein
MTVRAPDRRSARRYTVALPLSWAAGQTLTRDVSESGVFFETDVPVLAHSPIRFALVLGHSDPEGRFVVECEGMVVRVESRSARLGVAVHITSYAVARDQFPTRRDPAT